MQEFGSFSGVASVPTFSERVALVAANLDHSPEIPVDLSTLEAGVATLVANSDTSIARMLTMVEQLIDMNCDNELALRELKKIHFQLADMTDNFIEEAD